jgi:hypothetical protein
MSILLAPPLSPSEWVDRINHGSNIETFIDEQLLDNSTWMAGVKELNWMRIFNSKIPLSKCFVVKHIHLIEWNWLVRPLEEAILERYKSRVVQWNAQLYGRARTFEFMVKYQDRFDWIALSANPPAWFTEVYFDTFGSKMDWSKMSHIYKTISNTILNRYVDRLNWNWISQNDIRSEAFAILNLRYINWNHPNLDTSNLSTEFLYDVRELQHMAYQLTTEPLLPVKRKRNRLMAFITPGFSNGYNPLAPIRIGASITLRFAVDHSDELNWVEMNRKGLVTAAITEAVANDKKNIG